MQRPIPRREQPRSTSWPRAECAMGPPSVSTWRHLTDIVSSDPKAPSPPRKFRRASNYARPRRRASECQRERLRAARGNPHARPVPQSHLEHKARGSVCPHQGLPPRLEPHLRSGRLYIDLDQPPRWSSATAQGGHERIDHGPCRPRNDPADAERAVDARWREGRGHAIWGGA